MINTLARNTHRHNVAAGWWDEFDNKLDRYETAMMLCVSEIAEAMEGFRKDLMDDHLPEYKMFDVELADAMIRLLDLAGAYGVHLEDDLANKYPVALRWHREAPLRKRTVPEQLYEVVRVMTGASPLNVIERSVNVVRAIADINDVDLWKLVELKHEYNKTRADHKITARNAVGGKKF